MATCSDASRPSHWPPRTATKNGPGRGRPWASRRPRSLYPQVDTTQHEDLPAPRPLLRQPRASASFIGHLPKDGEYWTVGWGGDVFRLKDTKGFAYIAHLLRHPATEFHALDLVGVIAHHRDDDESPPLDAELEATGLHVARSEDAGEMLDEQAKATYRQRLVELREELDAAKTLGQVRRAEVAERDMAILTSELSRAVGLPRSEPACRLRVRTGTAERHEDDSGRDRAQTHRAERRRARGCTVALHPDGCVLLVRA